MKLESLKFVSKILHVLIQGTGQSKDLSHNDIMQLLIRAAR